MADAPYNQTRTGPEGGGDYRTSSPPQAAYRLGQGQTNADTGQTYTPGRFGQFQTNDLATLWDQAKRDPAMAAMILRLAQGQTGRPLGFLAGDRDSLYGKALQTALSLGGLGDFGSVSDIANQFLQQGVLGNDLTGYASGLGQGVLGMDFAGMDSDTMSQALQAGLALQGIDMGGIGAAQHKGQLQDILWAALERELADKNNDQKNFADLLQGSPYQQAMQAFR